MGNRAIANLPTVQRRDGAPLPTLQVNRMRAFFTLAFLAALVLCTLLAVRTWYGHRGREVEPAERRVFLRFVAGVAVFWLVAIAGWLGGLMSF